MDLIKGAKYAGAAFTAAALVSWGSSAALGATQTTAAATPALAVTLSADPSSTAVWNTSGDPVLTSGSVSGASAQVDVVSPSATAPSTAPTFTSSPASVGGDPRWVIEFHNGTILTDNGTGDWTCDSGTNDGTYATGLANCEKGGLDDQVTAAFIVADAGEAGKAFTLTNIQYGGATVQVQTSGKFVMKNALSGKCLNINAGDYLPGGTTNQWDCYAQWAGKAGGAQTFQYQQFADGSQYLEAINPWTGAILFVQATSKGQALSLTSTLTPYTYGKGGFFGFKNNTLVMDDSNYGTGDGNVIWGWPKTGATNQQWSLESNA